MFKQYIAILFLLAFAAQTFSKAIIVCSFYANRDYIAKNLCENRTKPKSCCAGKCQLRKKLNKETNQEKQANEKKGSKETVETLSSKSFFTQYQQPFLAITNTNYCIHPNAEIIIGTTRSIFHPPNS